MGEVKSPQIRQGGENFEFSRVPELTLFKRDSIETPQFGGPKSKLSKDNFRGELPPLYSSVRGPKSKLSKDNFRGELPPPLHFGPF